MPAAAASSVQWVSYAQRNASLGPILCLFGTRPISWKSPFSLLLSPLSSSSLFASPPEKPAGRSFFRVTPLPGVAGGGARPACLRGLRRKVYSSRPMRSIMRDLGARSSRLHCRGRAAEPPGLRRGRHLHGCRGPRRESGASSSTRPHCATSSRGLRERQLATVLGEGRAFGASAARSTACSISGLLAGEGANDEQRQQQRRISRVQPQR
jgi:hypothetical protein